MNGELQVPLPLSVERLLNDICIQKVLPLPDVSARRALAQITEDSAMNVLRRVSSTSKSIYNISGYIVWMANKYGLVASNAQVESETICLSPNHPSSPSSSSGSSSPGSKHGDDNEE